MDYYELNNPVFAVQGDNIFDIKVKNLIDFHKEKGACLTIVLREVDNVEGLGIADIDKNGRIQRFVEKPLPKDAPATLPTQACTCCRLTCGRFSRKKASNKSSRKKTV